VKQANKYSSERILNELIPFCKEQNLPIKVIDERQTKSEITVQSKLPLRYQQMIWGKYRKIMVLLLRLGSWKNVLGLELIAKKSQPALILVYRKQLMDQGWPHVQVISRYAKKDMDKISGSKKNSWKRNNRCDDAKPHQMKGDEKKDNKCVGTIIIDECTIFRQNFRRTYYSV